MTLVVRHHFRDPYNRCLGKILVHFLWNQCSYGMGWSRKVIAPPSISSIHSPLFYQQTLKRNVDCHSHGECTCIWLFHLSPVSLLAPGNRWIGSWLVFISLQTDWNRDWDSRDQRSSTTGDVGGVHTSRDLCFIGCRENRHSLNCI